MTGLSRAAIALVATAALAGCNQDGRDRMPEPRDGKALFSQYCAVCHGERATGDGPLAASLRTTPRDLTTLAIGNGGSFPRARVMATVDGYTRRGNDRPDMPRFGELLESQIVPFDSGDGIQTPTPRDLVALVEYLETIQKTR